MAKSLLVLAGAGASKAVSPTDYPTTVEFFQRLPKAIKSNKSFELALQYLTRGKPDPIVDIEQILWVFQELNGFLDGIQQDDTVPGWFLQNNRLGATVGVTLDYKSLFNFAPNVKTELSRVIEQIDRRVFDLYGRAPSPDRLEDTWLPLLRSLLNVADRCDLFTTNYDLVIEVALDALAQDPKLPTIDSGRRGTVLPQLDLTLWSGQATDRSRNIGLLTKLHGSIDWGRGPSTIYLGDPLYKGSDDRHVIVYPGFKGFPRQNHSTPSMRTSPTASVQRRT